MSEDAPEDFEALWSRIKQEITGIQLLWEAVEQVYFRQPLHNGMEHLAVDTPLLYRLMHTAMMESLLIRMSRLMDPAATGKHQNLSLIRLAERIFEKRKSKVNHPESEKAKSLDSELRKQWDGSGLKIIRDKYLSHNDLACSMAGEHTLIIPLSSADIEVMRTLATALREFRCAVGQEISGVPYLDEFVSLQVRREIGALNRRLLLSECFYKLLPDHAFLQDALCKIESGSLEGDEPC